MPLPMDIQFARPVEKGRAAYAQQPGGSCNIAAGAAKGFFQMATFEVLQGDFQRGGLFGQR